MSEYGNLAALFGGQPFDPNAHEPSKDFEVLPPNKYTCLIEDATLVDTRNGTGKFIKVVLGVLEGTHENRKLFDNINVQNPHEECQRMGIAQLSALGRAAGVYPVSDTADLKDKVVIAVVKVKKRKDTGEDQNDVRTYENPSTSTNAQHAPAAASTGYVPPQVLPQGPLTFRADPPTQQPAAPVATAPATVTAVPPAAGAPGNAPWKR